MTAPGLGLGLAVARTIARVEGGNVNVHTRAGGGLVARVELPRGAGLPPQ
jgi:two-component system osmolarity sensor histidine kinase EnvZ